MSFFGSDGLEHQLRQLKVQLSSKDSEITSVRNELRKKTEEVNESKRVVEEAQYRVQEEAIRADRAETALQQKTTELATMRLQNDNLESALRAANNKLQAGQKENGRLQYDLDVVGDASEESRRLKQEHASLTTKVKDLEQKLARAEEANKTLRQSTAGQSTLKRSATDFFGNVIASPPKRGNRRRSTSLNADNRVSELEAEVEMLRAGGGLDAETEKLKTQLTTAKRELDKATNAKLALERSSQRAIDELKSQLEDSNYELEDWRRNDGSGGKAELEKIKKTAQAQTDAALTKVKELEGVVKDKEQEIQRLEQQLERIDQLETALEEARSKVSTKSPVDEEQVEALKDKIASLESELVTARSSSSAPLPDKNVRQLQREVKTLQTQITSLNAEIAAQDDELYRLRGAIPLPASPSLKAVDSAASQEKITELETKLEEAGNQAFEAKAALADAEARNKFQSSELSRAIQQRDDLETQLSTVKGALASSETRVKELESELETLRTTASGHQAELDQVRTEADQARTAVEEQRQQLEQITQQHAQLTTTLATRSHDDAEVQTLRETLETKEKAVAALEAAIAGAENKVAETGSSVETVRSELEAAKKESDERQTEIHTLMDRLVESEDRLKAALNEKKTVVKNVKDKHREAAAEVDNLRQQLEAAQAKSEQNQEHLEEMLKAKLELETALSEAQQNAADRSTDSDARQRDEALLDAKEAVAKLEATLATEREEHTKELEGATFVLKKDLEEAHGRISGLEKEVGESRTGIDALRLMKEKIGKLRKERDELRVSLNFINHEQRFTTEAAESSRAALDTARIDLENKTAVLERLQTEHRVAEARFGTVSAQLEADLKEASTSRDTLSTKVCELEEKLQDSMAEHRLQAEQSGSLVSELAIARSKASRAESEMMVLRKANHDFEIRVDHLQATLDAKLETDALNSSSAPAETERPGSALGHRRRRSGLPGLSLDALENLKVEKADLLGRLARRDARIRALETELKQAKVNLQLAEDAATENGEDLEEAIQKVEEVQASLDKATSALESSKKDISRLESDLASAREQVGAGTVDLRSVVLALAVHHTKAMDARRHWTARVDTLRQSDTALDRIRESATAALEGARTQLDSLNSKTTKLEGEVSETRAKLETSSTELESARAELDSARTAEKEVRGEVDTLKASLSDAQTKLENAEKANAELATTADRVVSLESELNKSKDELNMRQADIEELLIKLASTEKSRGMSEADSAAQAATLAQLEAAKAEAGTLQGQVDALLEDLSGLQAAHDKAAHAHLQEVEDIRAGHSTAVDSLSAELGETKKLLENKVAELERAGRLSADLQEQLDNQRDNLTTATAMSESDREVIDDLRAKVAEMDKLSEHVEVLKKDIEAARNDASTARQEAETSSAAVTKLEAAVRSSQASLESAQRIGVEAAEKSAALQAEVQALKSENESVKAQLASAGQGGSSSTAAVAELEERVSELEASLQLKVQEVDEADDRVRDAYKDKAKLEKKVAKLQRQLASATSAMSSETAANTAANRNIPPPAVEMGPPPVPSARAGNMFAPRPQVAADAKDVKVTPVAASPRQPFRPQGINVFDPKPSPGLKRSRDDKLDDKPMPADCIILPPSQPTSAKKAARSTFTPQRHGGNVFAPPVPRMNIFAQGNRDGRE